MTDVRVRLAPQPVSDDAGVATTDGGATQSSARTQPPPYESPQFVDQQPSPFSSEREPVVVRLLDGRWLTLCFRADRAGDFSTNFTGVACETHTVHIYGSASCVFLHFFRGVGSGYFFVLYVLSIVLRRFNSLASTFPFSHSV